MSRHPCVFALVLLSLLLYVEAYFVIVDSNDLSRWSYSGGSDHSGGSVWVMLPGCPTCGLQPDPSQSYNGTSMQSSTPGATAQILLQRASSLTVYGIIWDTVVYPSSQDLLVNSLLVKHSGDSSTPANYSYNIVFFNVSLDPSSPSNITIVNHNTTVLDYIVYELYEQNSNDSRIPTWTIISLALISGLSLLGLGSIVYILWRNTENLISKALGFKSTSSGPDNRLLPIAVRLIWIVAFLFIAIVGIIVIFIVALI